MNSVFEGIKGTGILPVINISDVNKALPLAGALRNGGLNHIEITLRSEHSLSAIALIKDVYPDMIVGAGTILNTSQVDDVLAAGADFAVSPGFNEKINEYCSAHSLPHIPGCTTASEIEHCLNKGISLLKFFPSEPNGGVSAIELLRGPYPDARFIPTGGIDITNLEKYMACENVIAAGGSFMARNDMVSSERWNEITALCKKCVDIALGFKLAHVGINGSSEEESYRYASRFADIFGLPVRGGSKSVFAGNIIECTKMKFPGSAGHIAISTYSIERARYHMKLIGVPITDHFMHYDERGNVDSFYLSEEIAGFAIHIMKNH